MQSKFHDESPNVERQYRYLHRLGNRISAELGDEVATVVLIYQEWARLAYPLLSRIFDLTSASGVAVSYALYRIVPLASGVIKKLQNGTSDQAHDRKPAG
jgi:hypothetical protein